MQLKQGYRDSGVAGAVMMRISQTFKLSLPNSLRLEPLSQHLMSMLLCTLLRTPFPLLALYCFPFSPNVCLPFRVCKLFQLLSLPLLSFVVTLVTKVEGYLRSILMFFDLICGASSWSKVVKLGRFDNEVLVASPV